MHNSHFVHGILKYVLRNWNLINLIILASSWTFLSETKFFVDDWAWWAAVYGVAQSRTRLKRLSGSSTAVKNTKTTKAVQHCLVCATGLTLSHTTAFVNIISRHIYTAKQTISEYYYIHSFDLTNSLKKSRGPPWTHRSCFENYCPTHPLRVIAHVTSPRNFTFSFVPPFNLYKLRFSTYILLHIVHYIIFLS